MTCKRKADNESQETDSMQVDNSHKESEQPNEAPKKVLKIYEGSIQSNSLALVLSTDEEPDNMVKIIHLLKNAKPSIDFSHGGEARELPPIPGLIVAKFGEVSFPFDQRQAEQVLELFSNPKDSNIEFFPSTFQITHPEWKERLQQLVTEVSEELGCDAEVEAKLDKLIFCQPGIVSKNLLSESEVENVFGKLIIELPNRIEGGEIAITNQDGTKTIYDFGQGSKRAPYATHFSAFYSKANFELLNITSGYRLTLVYSLCSEQFCRDDLCYSNIVSEMTCELKKIGTTSYCNAIILQNEYSIDSIKEKGVKALKGKDNKIFKLLEYGSRGLESDDVLEILILHTTVSLQYFNLSSDFDQWEEDECEREITIEGFYNCKGEEVFESFGGDFDFFTALIDPVEGESVCATELNEANYWEFDNVLDELNKQSKNEDNFKTVKKEKYFLVFYPKKFDYEMNLEVDFDAEIDELKESLDSLQQEEINCKITSIINYVKENAKTMDSYSIRPVLEVLGEIKSLEYTRAFIQLLPDIDEPLFLYSACLVRIFSWEILKDCFEHLLSASSTSRLYITCKFVKQLFVLCDEQTAFCCLKDSVLSILDNQTEFEKLKIKVQNKFYCGWFNFSSKINVDYFDLFQMFLETMMLFRPHLIEEHLAKFSSLLIGILNEPDELNNFLERIKMNVKEFKKSPSVVKLFESRLKWLEAHTPPIFTWYMPGPVPGHPEVECFLMNRDLQKMIYTNGKFQAIWQARQFIKKHNGLRNGYSLSMYFTGKPPSVAIHIIKTTDYYANYLKDFHKYRTEIVSIKDLLKN